MLAMTKAAPFDARDPSIPAFWDERFARQFTPWDRGGVPQALREFVAACGQPPTCLIPGCGAAHELAFLCEAGWDAVAIDFSPAAVALARSLAGPWSERIIEADFFSYAGPQPLDMIYERAFLCALPRSMWTQVGARWAQLLAPGALLVGYFHFDDNPKGPPFGIARAELDALLLPHFECIVDDPVLDSIAVFAGKERWMMWRRRLPLEKAI
jgi:SAM-dependent methyltransferase